jgi:hypothetical protein
MLRETLGETWDLQVQYIDSVCTVLRLQHRHSKLLYDDNCALRLQLHVY